MKESFKTVAKEARELYIDKKSKFIAAVRPTPTEEEALAFLEEIRSEFPDATHHVYAYVIGENQIFRYSDDGEPSQTAGMPVLDVIRREGLVDVTVVVTRYFGGTLLGTGGLVHAYSTSAAMGVHSAGVVTRTLCNIVSVRVDYTLVGKIQHKIANEHYLTEETVYDRDVTFMIICKIAGTERLIQEMVDLSSGRAICRVEEQKWVDLPEESHT